MHSSRLAAIRWAPAAGFLLVFALTTYPVWERLLLWAGLPDMLFVPGGALHRPYSSNDVANFATIDSLVERHTWAIDRSPFRQHTMDIAQVSGHVYSVRPPMLAFVASAVYAAVHHGLGLSLWTDFATCHWILVTAASGLAAAVLAALVGQMVVVGASSSPVLVDRDRDQPVANRWLGICAAVTVAFGSLVLPYATVLNHHVVAAALVTSAVAILLRGELAHFITRRAAIGIGAFSALAATIDVAGGGIFFLAVAAWVLSSRTARPGAGWTAIAAAAVFSIHAILNFQIVGNPIPLLVQPDHLVFPGGKLRAEELSGLFHARSATDTMQYALALLWGGPADTYAPRGLLLYSPVTIYAAISAVRLIRGPSHPLRPVAVFLGAGSILYLSYLVFFSNNCAGTCFGVRWFVLLAPFAHLLVFGAWCRLTRGERFRSAISLAASAAIAVYGVAWGAWMPLTGSRLIAVISYVVAGLLVVEIGLAAKKGISTFSAGVPPSRSAQ